MDDEEEMTPLGMLTPGLCIAMPEMSFSVHDRLFGALSDPGLFVPDDMCEATMEYLLSAHARMQHQRRLAESHRRVQVFAEHAWHGNLRDNFSASSDASLSRIRQHILRDIPRVARKRCRILDHGRPLDIAHDRLLRDIVGPELNPIKFVMVVVGGRGGGKRGRELTPPAASAAASSSADAPSASSPLETTNDPPDDVFDIFEVLAELGSQEGVVVDDAFWDVVRERMSAAGCGKFFDEVKAAYCNPELMRETVHRISGTHPSVSASAPSASTSAAAEAPAPSAACASSSASGPGKGVDSCVVTPEAGDEEGGRSTEWN
jgi:hypothetical protein